MTNWYCNDCPVTGTDCGPWDDSNNIFKNIKSVHKGHQGFQIGELKLQGKQNWRHTKIEKEFSKVFDENIDEWFHNLVAFYKLMGVSEPTFRRWIASS